MKPQEKIQADLAHALKQRDKLRVSTLRMLLAAIENARIAQGEEIDEATFLKLVQKAIKQRSESAEAYEQGGRAELAAKERAEAELLEGYLPEQADEAEIRADIERFLAAEGLEGMQAMGRVMQEMTARFAGRADGGTISRIARELLS